MSGCVFGTVTFDVAGDGDRSTLTLVHAMMGVLDDEVIGMYRGGWETLLAGALKAFVEHGTEAWSAA